MYHNVSQCVTTQLVKILLFSFLTLMTETRAAVLVRLSLTLKSRLLEIAKREHRSLSKQVEFLLERVLESESPDEPSGPTKSSSGEPSERTSKDRRVKKHL